jgi:hypothetical protein
MLVKWDSYSSLKGGHEKWSTERSRKRVPGDPQILPETCCEAGWDPFPEIKVVCTPSSHRRVLSSSHNDHTAAEVPG